MEKEIEIDIYQQRLNERLEKLQKCQKDKKVGSCFKCEKLLNCQIRDEYVQALYQSMSKGKVGGFEF